MSDVNPKAVKLRKDTDKYTDEIKLQVKRSHEAGKIYFYKVFVLSRVQIHFR